MNFGILLIKVYAKSVRSCDPEGVKAIISTETVPIYFIHTMDQEQLRKFSKEAWRSFSKP